MFLAAPASAAHHAGVTIPARYELKYVVAASRVPALRDAITGVCTLDRHSASAADRRYTVTSLYFDTFDLAFYRAKVDRAPRRLKLRARRYEGKGSPVFLEVKRRDEDIVRKTRALVNGDWATSMRAPEGGDAALHDFSAVLERTHAEPRLLVRYKREAWASVVDEYARVTFDSALEYQPWDELSFEGWPRAWLPLDDAATTETAASPVVLELKFSERAPGWMMSLARRFDLMRRGFSKYTAGVDQLWGRHRAYDLWLREPRFSAEP